MTEEAIKNLNIPRNKIAGIGVAAPGKVHVEDGVIVFYPRINGMVNYPIKSILESKLKLNVVVHNNCSVITSSVYHHTSIDCGDAMFAYLIRGGVNGALVTKDGIFTSSDGTTLEAGHIPVDVNGPECSCGLNGCLQAFLYQLDNEYTGKPFLSHDIFESIKNINVEKSKNIICKAAYYMFSSMKLIQRSFSPQSFLIICPSLTLAESIAFEIRKLYEISVDHFQSVKPKVFAVAYDNDLALIGASDLVLNQYFRQG